MVIFHSYVSLPEGTDTTLPTIPYHLISASTRLLPNVAVDPDVAAALEDTVPGQTLSEIRRPAGSIANHIAGFAFVSLTEFNPLVPPCSMIRFLNPALPHWEKNQAYFKMCENKCIMGLGLLNCRAMKRNTLSDLISSMNGRVVMISCFYNYIGRF